MEVGGEQHQLPRLDVKALLVNAAFSQQHLTTASCGSEEGAARLR